MSTRKLLPSLSSISRQESLSNKLADLAYELVKHFVIFMLNWVDSLSR